LASEKWVDQRLSRWKTKGGVHRKWMGFVGASTKLSLSSTAPLFHSVYSTPLSACAIVPPWCKEAPMQGYVSERRNSRRHLLKTKLRVRAWNSGWNERRAESENLSERGVFFATDAPLVIGSAVEVLLKMPEEISGRPTTEWRCTGHVVRLEHVDMPRGKLGVGIQFDCYEILRSEAALPS
jgi:hypothetical protein